MVFTRRSKISMKETSRHTSRFTALLPHTDLTECKHASYTSVICCDSKPNTYSCHNLEVKLLGELVYMYIQSAYRYRWQFWLNSHILILIDTYTIIILPYMVNIVEYFKQVNTYVIDVFFVV